MSAILSILSLQYKQQVIYFTSYLSMLPSAPAKTPYLFVSTHKSISTAAANLQVLSLKLLWHFHVEGFFILEIAT